MAIIASKMATRGFSVTVAIQNLHYTSPVKVGATVSCYTKVVKIDKASVQTNMEVWTSNISIIDKPTKMADG